VPALVKTTSYVYRGDEEAARKLHNLADLQLMKLRNLMSFNNLDQYSLTIYNKIGAYVKVSSNFGVEVAEIFYPKIKGKPEEVVKKKRIVRMKVAEDWTLLYAPCPLPDPQDWDGWIDAGKDDLGADSFLNEFSLLSFGQPIWGDFTIEGRLDITTYPGDYDVSDGGWFLLSASYQPGTIPPGTLYVGPVWQSVGICKKINTRNVVSYTLTFPANLVPSISVVNKTESGQKCWTANGGFYDHPEGFVYIPSNAYGVTTPPVCTYANRRDPQYWDPGFTTSSGEGYISWESMYMLGFWKQEWTSYNPSSYLNEDNYVLFYDKYSWSTTTSTDRLISSGTNYIADVWTALHNYGWYTEQMRLEYFAVIGPSGDHVNWAHYIGGDGRLYTIDPDESDYSYTSKGTITYETHMCGKLEGQWFDEVIGSATWNGTASWGATGAWTGDNIFPWMARIYPKEYLSEATSDEPKKHSEHNLLIVSWLKGAAAGYPSSTDKVPGCEGITSVTYRLKHGDTDISKTYDASHPGWHDVWTDLNTGRTWRAYGDLFAALKQTEFSSVEVGPPEWIDWWLADGSKFIVEEDDT